MELLLLSNSTTDLGYLVHALEPIRAWANGAGRAAFLPFAGVTRDWDAYEAAVAEALRPAGIEAQSVHRVADARTALAQAELIVAGGGNTFSLLAHCRRRGLLPLIAERVRSGKARYLGWSAGSNLACPTIRTTNDMPVVDPEGFDALGLVPFQINPHYMMNALPAGHRGETRDQRLAEFTRLEPAVPVLGLPEGDWLQVSGQELVLGGPHPAVWFLGAAPPQQVVPGPLVLPRESAPGGSR